MSYDVGIMSANPSPTPKAGPLGTGTTSRTIVIGDASNELVYAVVGHVGSGTSEIADALGEILEETEFGGRRFEVEIIKAREIISEWAVENELTVPAQSEHPTLTDVQALQDFGDKMRGEITEEGKSDYAAVARRMVGRIRLARARRTNVTPEEGKPVNPDGFPRAYILDSIRHPEEVQSASPHLW